MLLEDLIVTVLLLAFVGVITAIRLKARAQRAKPSATPPSRGSFASGARRPHHVAARDVSHAAAGHV
jgi:hypothetical protein